MKFSIRDLLLVTVIVALAVGWWVERRALAAKVDSQTRALQIAEWKLNAIAEMIEKSTNHRVVNREGWHIGLKQVAPKDD